MSDCKKHDVPLVTQQVDARQWKEVCPVCQYQDGEKLKERVKMLWERLGMPVEGYERGPILPG